MSRRDELAAVLGVHEARWTTYGNVRLYDVMHCASPDCDWSLRQKALMSNDDCYEAHRAHVADAVLAWLGEQLGDEGLIDQAADAIYDDAMDPEDSGGRSQAVAALGVVREWFGVTE